MDCWLLGLVETSAGTCGILDVRWVTRPGCTHVGGYTTGKQSEEVVDEEGEEEKRGAQAAQQ